MIYYDTEVALERAHKVSLWILMRLMPLKNPPQIDVVIIAHYAKLTEG
jgi:hypothetical protein